MGFSLEGVTTVDSATKNELFDRATMWFATYYRKSTDVLELKDKDGGRIAGKGSFPVYMKQWGFVGYIYYTIRLYFKEGKYKYIIDSFVHRGTNGTPSFGVIKKTADPPDVNIMFKRQYWVVFHDSINSQTPKIIKDLEDNMRKGDEKKNDW